MFLSHCRIHNLSLSKYRVMLANKFYVLLNFSVPRCNITNMMDHILPQTSPFKSKLNVNTPCAADVVDKI
jgi:hypothetical protein